MSSKWVTSPQLKSLKNLYCANCNVQFLIKDIVLRNSKCPMLLQCGHSVCESCLQESLRSVKSVTCQECNLVSPSESGEHGDDYFPLNAYVLGRLIALQNCKHEKDKKLASLTKNIGNFNYSVQKKSYVNSKADSGDSACEECSLAASWYCDNCKSNFCEICWSKVHGSAKSLMKHCKTALCNVPSAKNGFKKCPKHETQDLEFYCTSCSTTICSHCIILQHQGEGHCPITLKEKNLEMISKVKIAAEEAEVTKKRMKQTLKKIRITQNSEVPSNRLLSDLGNQIIRNFSRIHGILQLEEDRLLKRLHEKASERENCLKALSKQLEAQVESVESLLSDYKFAMKSSHFNDFMDLHKQLLEVQNLPCYIISERPNDEKEPTVTFDERLIEFLQVYCKMDVPSSEIFHLKSSVDLPEDYTFESLNDSDSDENPKFSVSDADSLSNCSSRELTKSESDVSPPLNAQKVFCERKNYSVHITYIKNPGEFYITLNSQRFRQQAIERKAYHFASCSSNVPKEAAKDEIYLVKYNVDKKWYRGRVVETSLKKVNGEKNVVMYYLDYGNTEVVPLSRLRFIPPDMVEEPPLAVKCKLFDCVPKNGDWCVESIKTMEKILNNYTATMFVVKIHQDCLEVDLSVIYPEGQIGRDIVSVRDALLFLELSSFVNGSKTPQNATAVRYPQQSLPSVGEIFDVIITHVNSPSDFYIQRTKQDTPYLCKLTEDLKNYYEENSHKGIIYSPTAGMPCAALFSVDQIWYRAKIVDIPSKKTVTVFYVDYGNSETISGTRIRKLRECFVRRPPLAINCALAGIHVIGDVWSSQTKSYLEKCVLAKGCRIQVRGRQKSKQNLKVLLYKQVNNGEICVNTLFIEMGCALRSSPNSSWMLETQAEEEPIPKSDAYGRSRGNPDADVAVDKVPSKSSDAENEPLRRKQSFKDRKRSKLSAKELRELHESEKKTYSDESSAAEAPKNEIDEYDNVFKVKVNILSAESPSSVYVTFPALMAEFKNMQSELNEFYKDSLPGAAKEWSVGSTCAVYDSLKCGWYRALVQSLLPNDLVKVFLKDVARVSTQPVASLRELDSSFTKFATCAVKCHLADIEPPEKRWPSISCEYLLRELENYEEVYMTKKGQIENKSLPIELWVKKIVSRGALEPTGKEWITLNKLLVNQGLAIPKKSKLQCGGRGPSDNDEESSDEVTESRNLCGESAEARSEGSTAVLPSLGSRWPPPEGLERSCFIGIPTYVDYNAIIYAHDFEQDEEKLKMVHNTLRDEYDNSIPTPEDHFWSVGQICVARYYDDNSWYRGMILQINENFTYEVLFVDYGNVETCHTADLRKRVKMQQVPILARKFQLQGIQPVSENGKWPIPVIEILHSLVVEKKCEITVLRAPLDSDEPYTVSLKIIDHDTDVAMFLVEQGLALVTRPNIPFQNVPASGRSSDLAVSRYESLTIPADSHGFFIEVTAVASENEFFAYIVDDDSLSPSLKSVVSEFENLQEQLMKECPSEPVLKNFAIGQPCCCLYPGNSKWYRGEIVSLARNENSVRVFFVDYGNEEFADKDLLHECRNEWLNLPKMAVKFRLTKVEKYPTVPISVYMKHLARCLKEALFFAEIVKNHEVLEVRLLTGPNGPLAYQEMIDENLMRFIE